MPKAKAESQGPTDLEPSTNPFTSEACFLDLIPISVIPAKNTTMSAVVMIIVGFILYHFLSLRAASARRANLMKVRNGEK